MDKMNGYNLIRNWYAFKFNNPSKCKAIHSDMYCYLVDLWNRLGQKNEFGLPTQVTMEVLGIGSYNTYKKSLDSLIEFGFVVVKKDSINQHQSKIVALSNFNKATDKALDKATIKATDKASDKASDTIYKPINQETNKPINDGKSNKEKFLSWFNNRRTEYLKIPSDFNIWSSDDENNHKEYQNIIHMNNLKRL